MSAPRAVVEIPGTFTAVYEDGRIVRLEFCPAVGHPAFRGAVAELVEWAEPQGPLDHPDGLDLDVESTDGPFWRAMQEALTQVPGEGLSYHHRVQIEWTE